MRRVWTAAAIIAAIVLVAASATMNFTFARSMGRTPEEGLILGAVAVGVDILKAVLALQIAEALRDRRWGFALIGTLTFVLFSALSLAAALGFAASNREAVLGEKARGNLRLAALEAQLGALRKKRDALPPHRFAALVDEDLATGQRDARWMASRQCSVINGRTLREFCDGVSRLRSERIASREAARLEQEIVAIEREMDGLRKAGGGIASDPQAHALAQTLGLSEAQVQRGLSALMAIVVEVGSGLGLFLAHNRSSKPTTRPTDSPHPVENEALAASDDSEPTSKPDEPDATAPDNGQRAAVVVRPRKGQLPAPRSDRPSRRRKLNGEIEQSDA